MTREEAKRRMEICRDFLANNYSDMGEPNFTAFNMAIQALSREPISLDDINDALEASFRNGVRSAKVEQEPCDVFDKYGNYKYPSDVELTEPNTATSMPCDDAISRDAVIKGIEELKKSPWVTDKRGNGFEYLITEALDVVKDLCIKQEPSVTQKSGKWIIRDDLSTVRYYQCSECNEIDLDISDYCPNCGAKMESEE